MTQFKVSGEPRGKARPRVTKHGTYTPKRTKEYERKIQTAYKMQAGEYFPGPVRVEIGCYFKIPVSKPKKEKEGMRNGTIKCTKRPDLDNICKAICDALNGLAFYDDSQIVELVMKKSYRDLPYVEVKIEEIE